MNESSARESEVTAETPTTEPVATGVDTPTPSASEPADASVTPDAAITLTAAAAMADVCKCGHGMGQHDSGWCYASGCPSRCSVPEASAPPVKPPASEAGASRNDQGCCSHLRVSYRTREEGVGHVVTAWWECDSGCGARFTVAPPASEAGHREDSDEGLDPLPPATLAETPAWDALVERIAEELYHSDCFPEHGPVGARKPHTFAQMPESTASEYRHMARCVMPVVEEHIRALVWAKAEAEALVMSHEGRLERAEQRVRDLEGALERVKRHRLFRTMFESAPCILCGYSGPGYYQPDAHPCAKVYHAALRGTGEGSNAPQ